MSPSASNKTIAFFGSSGGCGLAALKHAIDAGYTCIALCRTPSKMDAIFPEKPSNLIIKQGNAHDVDAVAACLTKPEDPSSLVDVINFTIGGKLDLKTMTTDDPNVCQKGMGAILEALRRLRVGESEFSDSDSAFASYEQKTLPAEGMPLLSVISTTGISEHQQDVPCLMMPMYKHMLKVPHADKKTMEQMLHQSPERWVLVRPSFLMDGAKPNKAIKVGIEDPHRGVEKKAVGYTISRDDVGRWMFESLLKGDTSSYEGKAVSISW